MRTKEEIIKISELSQKCKDLEKITLPLREALESTEKKNELLQEKVINLESGSKNIENERDLLSERSAALECSLQKMQTSVLADKQKISKLQKKVKSLESSGKG